MGPLQTLLLALAVALVVGLVCRESRHVWMGGLITAALLALLVAVGWVALARWHWFVNLMPAVTAGVVTFTAVTFTNYLSQRRHALLVKNIFEHYLDSSVVSTLIDDPAQVRLGGERREATVLFCDVANFTTTSETLTPENLVRFMNRYLDAMTDIVIEQGGFVDKFVGDEIVAIFGAPNPVRDHAVRACETVIRMREKLLTMQDGFREMGCRTEIFGRTGLNTGPMVVGNMGSESRMNYTAMGDTVNLGARLEGTTKIYGVRTLVGEATAEAARERFAIRELDAVRVKGKAHSVRVFELVGRTGEVPADAMARLTRFAEGVALYRAKRFEEALSVFEQNAAAGDEPSRTFAGRCRDYMATPPPADWDGSYTMLTK
jgi:adenylate cyclase